MSYHTKRAAIIPFFNYDPDYPATKNLLYKFFLRHLRTWQQYVDTIYVIDSGIGLFDPGDVTGLRIIEKPAQSHWQNLNEVVRNCSEDYILLLDSDMIIYKPQIIHENFIRLEKANFDIASIIDSSGHKDLWGKDKRRLCPYLCFLKKSTLPNEFDFTPMGGETWSDSMGYISEQLKDRNIFELKDDRSNIYNELEHGFFKHEQWMNDNTLPEHPNYGYYHIRNFGQGLKFLNGNIDPLIPPRERDRLMAWAFVVAEKAGYPNFFHPNPQFEKYFNEFKSYYPWLDAL